jgi:6-pyruvoyltetrahydropterin/6-carboxytetrahydropterin synthase
MPGRGRRGEGRLKRTTLTRRYQLPALHILSAPSLSAEENFSVFGPCSRLHGHDYQLEVTVSGSIDADSGLLMNRDELDRLVRKSLLDPYRGRNLSDYFPHTTGEALALEFHRILSSQLDSSVELDSITLRETAKNSFIVQQEARSQ